MATGKDSLRLALAQIDTTVGDLDQNAEKIAAWAGRARDEGAELVLFPELCLPGYPAEDLYLKPHFLEANQDVLGELAKRIEGLSALIGFAEPRRTEGENEPRAYNSLALVEGGEVRSVYRKNHLPNYGVFDERRYFEPASEPLVLDVAGVPLGLTICEDIWIPGEPETAEVDAGARLVLNASASPYHRGKGNERERMVAERARACAAPIVLCNAVGGQDELVFDGHSFIVDERGEPVARAAQFSEELLVCELALPDSAGSSGSSSGHPPSSPCPLAELLEPAAEVYAALRLGLRDYGQKNKFDHVVLGLSGGIDSALVALVAVDALGPERVTCVVMPSPHSSDETQGDARGIAENLGCELIELPISEAMKAYERALSGPFDGTEPGLAEENIQARIRGNYVMALSNRFGWLVLTTGNKSEMSVGYATLYGDMAGGFAVIKDVPKTLVYELVRWRNAEAGNELVPASVIERAPSAELRPEQRDEDSLPPYEVLDAILEAYVERDQSPEQMIEAGLPADEVAKAVWLVDKAEYKRRQAPPGIKITPKAFGRDRRLPITNRYRD